METIAESGRMANILLVEDDRGDQIITRRALLESKVRNNLFVVSDGAEALDFLFRRNQYQDPAKSPTPDLILLDLNMHTFKVSGREVLESINQDAQLKQITVILS